MVLGGCSIYAYKKYYEFQIKFVSLGAQYKWFKCGILNMYYLN